MPVQGKKTLEEVMNDINMMQQIYNKNTIADVGEIREYVNKELNNQTVDKNSNAAKYITELMARNPKIRKQLKESLPQTDNARKEKMKKLRTNAKRSGFDKLFHDFTGRKKRAAKKELAEIAQTKRRSLGGDKLHKSSGKSISEGRGRHIFTSMVNEEALGSKKERHGDSDSKNLFRTDDKIKDISLRTPEGRLKGAIYGPKPGVPDTGKVVIFFSGSKGTAGDQMKTALDDYLKMGVKVVAMDYRGFGGSRTLDKKGNEIGTPLSEKSLYKDGKNMLKYVLNNMKVKPENVILHGFSMGGAVASKVAADYAQLQQKKALEAGRNVKKLGGVVLHSPIATLKEAAYDSTIEDTKRGFMDRATASFMSGGAYLFGGAYSTRSHMRRLHKFDPDLPVHYVSGDVNAGDQLDIDVTEINRDPKANFQNASVHNGTGAHEGQNMDINNVGLRKMINQTRSDVPSAQTQAQPPAL
ncbi:Alpha/beta hydrolase family protein [Lachnospiraceae bacterium]|nr:Alpha/beta hydrolase family protein [Lachnospiraceae bacterium]